MTDKAASLLEKVDAAHDWQDGQTRGGSGTQLSRTDVCRVCGLKRHWFNDRQNNVHDDYTFTTHAGADIPLREAATLEC